MNPRGTLPERQRIVDGLEPFDKWQQQHGARCINCQGKKHTDDKWIEHDFFFCVFVSLYQLTQYLEHVCISFSLACPCPFGGPFFHQPLPPPVQPQPQSNQIASRIQSITNVKLAEKIYKNCSIALARFALHFEMTWVKCRSLSADPFFRM